MVKKKTPKKSSRKKDVVEYFDIKKDGKEKTIRAKGTETIEDKPSKKQVVQENRILINLIVIVGILVLGVLAFYFSVKSMSQFSYKGVDFEIVNEIAPYKTSIPVNYQGSVVPYNFYLRNDPRKLDAVEFDGEINFKREMVINSTGDLNCEGYGIIAVANLVNLYKIAGINVIKDEEASCDGNGDYMFLQIEESNKTNIEQFGPACYKINVNNCQVLESTEKFMIETFAELKNKGII